LNQAQHQHQLLPRGRLAAQPVRQDSLYPVPRPQHAAHGTTHTRHDVHSAASTRHRVPTHNTPMPILFRFLPPLPPLSPFSLCVAFLCVSVCVIRWCHCPCSWLDPAEASVDERHQHGVTLRLWGAGTADQRTQGTSRWGGEGAGGQRGEGAGFLNGKGTGTGGRESTACQHATDLFGSSTCRQAHLPVCHCHITVVVVRLLLLTSAATAECSHGATSAKGLYTVTLTARDIVAGCRPHCLLPPPPPVCACPPPLCVSVCLCCPIRCWSVGEPCSCASCC